MLESGKRSQKGMKRYQATVNVNFISHIPTVCNRQNHRALIVVSIYASFWKQSCCLLYICPRFKFYTGDHLLWGVIAPSLKLTFFCLTFEPKRSKIFLLIAPLTIFGRLRFQYGFCILMFSMKHMTCPVLLFLTNGHVVVMFFFSGDSLDSCQSFSVTLDVGSRQLNHHAVSALRSTFRVQELHMTRPNTHLHSLTPWSTDLIRHENSVFKQKTCVTESHSTSWNLDAANPLNRKGTTLMLENTSDMDSYELGSFHFQILFTRQIAEKLKMCFFCC